MVYKMKISYMPVALHVAADVKYLAMITTWYHTLSMYSNSLQVPINWSHEQNHKKQHQHNIQQLILFTNAQ